MRLPRLVIAGTHSSVGKTTVAVGVMAALAQRGLRVQPFKVGPDYIDPSFHYAATGRRSRNLDTWLLTPSLVRQVFERGAASADAAVIEGVMGLFDGHSSTNERGSTAEVAKLLRAPVLLVVDASHMARSIAAIIRGYLDFDPALRIGGILLNRVSGSHAELVKRAIRQQTSVPILGALPHDPGLSIPERHLGLIPAHEASSLSVLQERLASRIAEHVDLEQMLRIASTCPPLQTVAASHRRRSVEKSPIATIGVARDAAFHFYYDDNLDLLTQSGARLVEFSPLADAQLPDHLDGLYLGGGFPELFAAQLARNSRLRAAVRRAVAAGMPTYAECGGLMYLTQRLITREGRAHPMVGALPGSVRMTDRLQSFGYATLTTQRDTIVANAGETIRGHEFHYSTWDHAVPGRNAAYRLSRPRTMSRLEGFANANVLASYLHVHWLAKPRWAQQFVAAAQHWSQQSRRDHSRT